jgi:hypothetical protein
MMAQAITEAKKTRLPKGWFMAGLNPDNYEASVDKNVSHSGTKCAVMTNKNESGNNEEWATLMQMMTPSKYLDKRLRMTMWLKTDGVQGWAAPWMRVDGSDGAANCLSFDNMCTSQTHGTTDWKKCTIVLDVPKASTNIAYGVMLGGKGKLWIDDVEFEEVGTEVPTTDCPCMGSTSEDAVNLDFEEGSDDSEQPHKSVSEKSENLAARSDKLQDRALPKGWTYQTKREGTIKTLFDVGVDGIVTCDGKKAACIEVFQANDYAAVELSQMLRCVGLRGKRVRVTVQLKCAKIKGAATFSLEVFGPHEATLAMDDMSNRPLKGTKGWQRHELVVDVRDDAVELKFGGSVMGCGKLWFADLSVEEVGLDVPKTDNYSNGCRGIWWSRPINLDFSEDEDSAYLYQSCELGVTPKGWLTYADPAHGYEVGADDSVKRHGKRLGCIKAVGKRDVADNGLVFQKFDGKVYRGKRVRFTAFTKTSGVTGQCGLALWVLDSHQNEIFREDTFEFDSENDHDWTKREIVVHVPEHAGVLMISLELSGSGTVWMDDLDFEEVGDDVPLTKSNWKPSPKNLDFSQVYS